MCSALQSNFPGVIWINTVCIRSIKLKQKVIGGNKVVSCFLLHVRLEFVLFVFR